jgi:CRISPR-associated protein Cmx8
MAKKATKTPPTTVTVTYDLFDLPTAQHKAGLAGLLLELASLKNRKKNPPVPRVIEQTATGATIEFTEPSVQALFDDLYMAEEVEVKVKSKWANADLVREEEVEETVDGKVKKVRQFVYRQVQPSGLFLRHYVLHEPWIKLWRDMLWAIPRGIPKTREPYEQRAAGKPCKEGATAWANLLKVEAERQKNGFHTAPLVGSLLLGAQATNAELLPFEGRAEQNLLLHFWPLTSLVYVPQVVQPDGTSDFVGYVLAVPDVVDLIGFTADYPAMLAQLGDQVRGYRPAEALLDLPAQGALSFMEHLARLAGDKAESSELRLSVAAVEFMHVVKTGNTIKTMSSRRIAKPYTFEDYYAIVGRPREKPPYGNPLFRRGLMLAFLDERPWYRPFDDLFAEWPAEFVVRSEKSPKNLSWFWADARKKFQEVIQAMPTDPQPGDPPPDGDAVLADLLYRLTRQYLMDRAKDKSGIDPGQFRAGDKIVWEKVPPSFNEARRALAEGLFLEFRSRREQAFVAHFAATFFAVKQFLSPEQYTEIGQALLRRTDDVKTLTLMALSANS